MLSTGGRVEIYAAQNHSPGVTVAECNEQTVQGRKKKKKLPATIYLKFSLFSTVCLLSVFDLHSTDWLRERTLNKRFDVEFYMWNCGWTQETDFVLFSSAVHPRVITVICSSLLELWYHINESRWGITAPHDHWTINWLLICGGVWRFVHVPLVATHSQKRLHVRWISTHVLPSCLCNNNRAVNWKDGADALHNNKTR